MDINDMSKWKILMQDIDTNVFIYEDFCDEFMYKNGFIFSAAVPVIGNVKNAGLILTDTNFSQLENNVQQFILYHEIGHIKLKHLNTVKDITKKLVFMRSFGFTPKMEYDADEYAVSILGVNFVKQALLQLSKYNKLSFISKIEFLKRYIHLKYIKS